MTDEELRDIVARLTLASPGMQENTSQARSDVQEQWRETNEALRRTDEQISRTTRQLDRLDKRLGGCTERRAFEKLERVMTERFQMEFTAAHTLRLSPLGDESMEVDMLAYSVTRGEVIIVDIETNFDEAALQQALRALDRFPTFFTEHADKELFGIIAAVKISDRMMRRVPETGLVLARLSANPFSLDALSESPPKSFRREIGSRRGGR